MKAKRLTREDAMQRFHAKHGEKYDYSKVEYVNCYKKICIICPKHGEFHQQPVDHWKGRGCRKCGTESVISWTSEEDVFLEANYALLGCLKCAQALNKSYQAVKSRASDRQIKRYPMKHEQYEQIPNNLYNQLELNAYKRGFEVKIDKPYIWDLYLKQNRRCALTGWEIVFSKNRKVNTASVDRIDSDLGYVPGNVQIVNKHVNRAKVNYDELFFYDICRSMAAYRKKDFMRMERYEEWNEWHDTITVETRRILGRPDVTRDFSEEAVFGITCSSCES